MHLDGYGKKNAALSCLEAISIGETVQIQSSRFGGTTRLRNAINYFTRKHPGLRFSTRSGFPEKDIIYVKRIS